MTKVEELGTRIREARIDQGTRQVVLARYLAICDTQLWRYETGQCLPKISTLLEICEYLDLNFKDMSQLRIDAMLEKEMADEWQTPHV